MNKIENVNKIIKAQKTSSWTAMGYTVNLRIPRLKAVLEDYCDVESGTLNSTNMNLITPNFQRELGNWTIDMKKMYIQNLILGAPTNLILYTLDKSIANWKCKILDGQHRINAILEFMENKFSVFDEVFYSDLENHPNFHFNNSKNSLTIHDFLTEKDAAQFYIDINSGITHTPEDINKAKNYINSL